MDLQHITPSPTDTTCNWCGVYLPSSCPGRVVYDHDSQMTYCSEQCAEIHNDNIEAAWAQRERLIAGYA